MRTGWEGGVGREGQGEEKRSRFPNRSPSDAFPIAVAGRKANADAAYAMDAVASCLAGVSGFSHRERAYEHKQTGPKISAMHMHVTMQPIVHCN